MEENTAVLEKPTETGPAPTGPDAPQAQPSQDTPNPQPDNGPEPGKDDVPQEPNNVDKVDTDGKLKSSIDGKIPEGLTSKEEWLHTILSKEKAHPETEFSNDELDVLDEYYEGRLKPKEPEAKEAPDPDPDKKSEETEKSSEEDNSIEAVLKEVGAKSQEELLKKVKDLRKVVSGKVKGSPEYKQLLNQSNDIIKRFKNEMALMEDVKGGVPEALTHLESTYGIKIQRPDDKAKATKDPDPDPDTGDEYLDEVAGKKISGLEKQVMALTKELKSVQGSHEKIQEKFAGERAEASIIDEMVNVAEQVPILKEIKNLRNAVKAWWSDGKDDPRLNGFQNLFDVANEKGVDLMTAHLILAGKNSQLEIAKAKRQAKEEVYTQKPNRSLSDLQGRGVDNKPSYTESQVEEMINTSTLPEEWFDKDDNPNIETIPKQYLKYFFAPQELRS